MQTLIIPRLRRSVPQAADIPAAIQAAGIAYTEAAHVNWPEAYPYKPMMEFAAAHTGDALLLHYRVEEQSVRAVARGDHEHIWEDSCAEFFIAFSPDACPGTPQTGGLYYNIECNCTGKLLVAAGEGRNGRIPAPAETMQAVSRWASLGTEPFDTRSEPTRWELALRLPAATFFMQGPGSLGGLTATGNVYKCGDCLPVPHFISWSPIRTESPDFHRPDFFGQMIFE